MANMGLQLGSSSPLKGAPAVVGAVIPVQRIVGLKRKRVSLPFRNPFHQVGVGETTQWMWLIRLM